MGRTESDAQRSKLNVLCASSKSVIFRQNLKISEKSDDLNSRVGHGPLPPGHNAPAHNKTLALLGAGLFPPLSHWAFCLQLHHCSSCAPPQIILVKFCLFITIVREMSKDVRVSFVLNRLFAIFDSILLFLQCHYSRRLFYFFHGISLFRVEITMIIMIIMIIP